MKGTKLMKRLGRWIDACWAKYTSFQVISIVSFLLFVIVLALYTTYALYASSLLHVAPVTCIVILLGLQKKVFRGLAKAVRRKAEQLASYYS
jgi:hypothetical protein